MHTEPAEKFRILACESRLMIIELLKRRGPLCVSDLSEALGVTVSAVSQHLKILKQAGLVRHERRGYWIHYDVDPAALERCNETLAEVCNCGCRGSCRLQEAESTDAEDDLWLLLKRERELQEELRSVRTRIKEKRSTM